MPVGADAKSYLLRYKFKAGQKDIYKTMMTVQVSLPGQPAGNGMFAVSGNGDTVYHVLRIKPSGSAMVDISSPNFVMSNSSAPAPHNVKTVRAMISPRGEMSQVTFPSTMSRGPLMSSVVNPQSFSATSALLPLKGVKVGDTWIMYRTNFVRGAKPIKVVTRFMKIVNADHLSTVLLRSVYTIPVSTKVTQPGGVGPLQIKGTIHVTSLENFAPDQGKLVKMSLTGGGAVAVIAAGTQKEAPNMNMNLQITVTMDSSH
jgi:hypothetical protein